MIPAADVKRLRLSKPDMPDVHIVFLVPTKDELCIFSTGSSNKCKSLTIPRPACKDGVRGELDHKVTELFSKGYVENASLAIPKPVMDYMTAKEPAANTISPKFEEEEFY